MGAFFFVLPCIGRGLAMGQSPIQRALQSVYKQDPKIWQNMRLWTMLVFHAIQEDLRIFGFLNLISVSSNNENLNHALHSVHNLYASKRYTSVQLFHEMTASVHYCILIFISNTHDSMNIIFIYRYILYITVEMSCTSIIDGVNFHKMCIFTSNY
jgi:hypothetical protein